MQDQTPVADLSFRLSAEETARFGVRCARADDVAIGQFDELLAVSRREGVQLLIFRCDVRSTATAQRAEREGFQLMDKLVHAALDIARPVAIPSPAAARIRIAEPGECGAVGSLSRSAFTDHVGHYHADPRLPKESAADAYGDWAERLCRSSDHNQPCFVAHDASGLAGFLALRATGPDEVNCALCAVAPRAQRQGVLRALLATAVQWAASRNYARLTYATQTENTGALRAISAAGFHHERASYTFHKWFEPDAGASAK